MIHHLLEPYLPQLYGISSNDNTRVEVSKKIVNAIENQNEQLHSQGISHLLNKLAENGMDRSRANTRANTRVINRRCIYQ